MNKSNKSKIIAEVAVSIGIILYLSKFTRSTIFQNESALFILGFLPNFGMAFAIPFIYVSHQLRKGIHVKYFSMSCALTILLMIFNEIKDKYQAGRTYDVLDIYASVAGVAVAYALFRFFLKKTIQDRNTSILLINRRNS